MHVIRETESVGRAPLSGTMPDLQTPAGTGAGMACALSVEMMLDRLMDRAGEARA